MFSGIIQVIAPIRNIHKKKNFNIYTIILPKNIIKSLKVGSSVSNNGCCLTVISIKNNLVSFNIINETLKLTNMSTLRIGDLVNIETSLNYHGEIGGHLMTGHIDCTGKIVKIIYSHNNKIIWFKIMNKYFTKHILEHGSIGVEGVSLTINKIFNNYIRIALTPYTAKNTNLGSKIVGSLVNIETDMLTKIIVSKVEKLLMTNRIMKNKLLLKI